MTNMMTGERQAFMDSLSDVVRRDQTRRERRKKIRTATGKAAQFLILAAVMWALRAWVFMLAVAVIHDHWLPNVPTLGFWWAGLIIWLIRGALEQTSKSKKTEPKTH